MIRHHDKVIDLKFLGSNIRPKNVNKESSHSFGLQERLAFDVTKNVRSSARIELGSEFREGFAMRKG